MAAPLLKYITPAPKQSKNLASTISSTKVELIKNRNSHKVNFGFYIRKQLKINYFKTELTRPAASSSLIAE